MKRKREIWAFGIAAAIILLSLAVLWVSPQQSTAPVTVEETDLDVDAPNEVEEAPPSATGDLDGGN
ncbi:hypothetical protein [Hoeflea ulvae]|uniref:Uncharacterized protein n=1 Tax=Hoeflea ulvae TaxID=2983764 RepID=A0ABT3YM09_9HYPH|nr:hypothetical protein [Hoeflea ulvae]MCY0096938.1 hypothetical protein [Hoeflea ulvae]